MEYDALLINSRSNAGMAPPQSGSRGSTRHQLMRREQQLTLSLGIVDNRGRNVLLVAAEADNVTVVRQILEDPRAASLSVNHRDSNNNFLLFYAVSFARHPNIRLKEAWCGLARQLLARPDIDVNLRGPGGRTMLMEACLQNHPVCRQNLVSSLELFVVSWTR